MLWMSSSCKTKKSGGRAAGLRPTSPFESGVCVMFSCVLSETLFGVILLFVVKRYSCALKP